MQSYEDTQRGRPCEPEGRDWNVGMEGLLANHQKLGETWILPEGAKLLASRTMRK